MFDRRITSLNTIYVTFDFWINISDFSENIFWIHFELKYEKSHEIDLL